MEITKLRKEYSQRGLRPEDLHNNPLKQFEIWFKEACRAKLPESNALNLATVSPDGTPTQRTVLLKYLDHQGFVFFTNYGSTKAQHMEKNPQVSLLFLWIPLERQVQICGKASKISRSESLKYFLTRPLGSQLGAWSSQQSSPIPSREILNTKLREVKEKFMNREIPLPPFWGGYRVVPHSIEFWQGRPNRLHDRFLYSCQPDDSWKIQRLAP